MLIPTPTRRAIHEALFADGVLVAIKNVHHKEHCTIKTASNLHVIKAMQVCDIAPITAIGMHTIKLSMFCSN